MRRLLLSLPLLLLAGAAALPPPPVRMNQVQVVGTHNSYHAGLTAAGRELLRARSPAAVEALDYSHPPLSAQLDAGVRQVELDVFADAAGGRFAHPQAAAAPGAPPFDRAGVMRRPGWKVLHVQDLDPASTCPTFVACLRELRAWSRAHPRHAPLYVLVETKASTPRGDPPLTAPEPVTPAALDSLDAEVRAVFPEGELVTPDVVRGRRATLEEAVLQDGWPTLERARGRVVFLLDQRADGPAYLQGRPVLQGRVFFTNAEPGRPDAAFVERNEGSAEEIAALVRRGYLVRTRADADTRQGRSGDVRRRDTALASGAQLVSTDYPASEPARWTGYAVALPGRVPVRCNPVNAPPGCVDDQLDR